MASIGDSQEEERWSANVEYYLLWIKGAAVAAARRVAFVLLDLEVIDGLRGCSLPSSLQPRLVSLRVSSKFQQ